MLQGAYFLIFSQTAYSTALAGHLWLFRMIYLIKVKFKQRWY